MKIRSGFVSNSSSSSFIAIGCDFPKKMQTRLAEQLKVETPEDSDWMYDGTLEKLGVQALYTKDSRDDGYIIGKVLADGDDYMENGSVTLEEMSKHIADVKKVVGEDANVKLIYGTRPS